MPSRWFRPCRWPAKVLIERYLELAAAGHGVTMAPVRISLFSKFHDFGNRDLFNNFK